MSGGGGVNETKTVKMALAGPREAEEVKASISANRAIELLAQLQMRLLREMSQLLNDIQERETEISVNENVAKQLKTTINGLEEKISEARKKSHDLQEKHRKKQDDIEKLARCIEEISRASSASSGTEHLKRLLDTVTSLNVDSSAKEVKEILNYKMKDT